MAYGISIVVEDDVVARIWQIEIRSFADKKREKIDKKYYTGFTTV